MSEPVKRKFQIENGEKFEGIDLDPKGWNGWACPGFTKEVGLQIAKEFSDQFNTMFYAESVDAFVYIYDGGDSEYFHAKEVNGVKYYPIGAWGWVWERAS